MNTLLCLVNVSVRHMVQSDLYARRYKNLCVILSKKLHGQISAVSLVEATKAFMILLDCRIFSEVINQLLPTQSTELITRNVQVE